MLFASSVNLGMDTDTLPERSAHTDETRERFMDDLSPLHLGLALSRQPGHRQRHRQAVIAMRLTLPPCSASALHYKTIRRFAKIHAQRRSSPPRAVMRSDLYDAVLPHRNHSGRPGKCSRHGKDGNSSIMRTTRSPLTGHACKPLCRTVRSPTGSPPCSTLVERFRWSLPCRATFPPGRYGSG